VERVVGWATPDPLDEDAIDLVLEHLEGHHAVITRHPVDGTWEATISLQAPTLDAAVTAALDLVAGATAETPIGVEVLREDLWSRLPGAEARSCHR
jgi:hypothetical protein